MLRFLSLWTLSLLLINPKFKQTTYVTDKVDLVLAIDNSGSIAALDQVRPQQEFIDAVLQDEEIQQKFDLRKHLFSNNIEADDSLNHQGQQSDLYAALKSLEVIYEAAPIVLLSDGNQTYGSDYSYALQAKETPVFPVVLGDSTAYTDLKISRLNVNKYAYIKNRFPVEVLVNYAGSESITSEFTIRQGPAILFRKTLNFSQAQSSQLVNVELQAASIGLQRFTAVITPLSEEKNKSNNQREFAVEVIDQRTNVALVSDIVHPDLGALKEAIESNQQRKVSVLKPNDPSLNSENYQVILLYQPNQSFQKVLTDLATKKFNVAMVAGPNTDLNYLNNTQRFFTQEVTGQKDDVLASQNPSFKGFQVSDIGFDNLPPLQSGFGDILMRIPSDLLLSKSIDGIQTNEPLLVTSDVSGQRGVFLFGEGIWRWRSQSFVNTGGFEDFDGFIDTLIQFLASNNQKSRLTVSYESVYYGSANAQVSAQYFDKNFVFDPNATLSLRLTDVEDNTSRSYPMLLSGNQFEVDLSNVNAGKYRFDVIEERSNSRRGGSFEIIDFDVEKQFLNADVSRLQQLASNTSGSLFFSTEFSKFKEQILEDRRFTPVQRSEENVVPLIDWKWLLALLAALLAIEWFSRKYKGLI